MIIYIGVVIIMFSILIISYYFYKKSRTCNNNNCDNLVTLGNWELSSETSDKATLIKKCTNIKTNVDGCSQLDPTILTKEINWSDITCNKACGADANGYKSLNIDNINIISKNTYPCNTETCDSLVNFGNWTLNSETIDNAIINRTCTNKDNTRDACSLIPVSDLNKTIPWNGFTTCSKVCDSGSNNKTTIFDNITFTSTTSYPCNIETCNSLVNFGNWTKVSESDDNVTVNRSCTNKNSDKNACSLIPSSDLNKTLSWNGTNTCSKVCNTGSNNKTVVIDNTTITSTNSYPCNTETCNSLVNFGNWTKISETSDNVNINRLCTNKNSNRNACSLIPNTDLNKTISWTGYNTCSDNKYNRIASIDNITYTSTSSYPCLNIIQPSDFKISLSAYSLLLNNNNKVSSWGLFTQNNDIYKPTFINDTFPYVKFTGDSNNRTFLSFSPSNKNINYASGKGATFIVLARYNALTQFNRTIAHTGGSGSARTFEWIIYNDNNNPFQAKFYYVNTSGSGNSPNYIQLNKFCLYVVRFDNDANSVEIFRNNVSIKKINDHPILPGGTTDTYFVGAQDITGVGNNTDLVYTSIYERPLTNTELTNLYNSVKSICQD